MGQSNAATAIQQQSPKSTTHRSHDRDAQSKLAAIKLLYDRHRAKGETRGRPIPTEIRSLARELNSAGVAIAEISRTVGLSETAVSKWLHGNKKKAKPKAKAPATETMEGPKARRADGQMDQVLQVLEATGLPEATRISAALGMIRRSQGR